MKTLSLSLVAVIAALACASAAVAQSPAPAAPQAIPGRPATGLASLSPDERAALAAADQKAEQDPEVKDADAKRRAARKVLFDKLAAQDPDLKAIVDKIQSTPAGQTPPLSTEEREQLISARGKVMGTPDGDAMVKAENDFRTLLRAKMVAIDPSLSGVFARLSQPRSPQASGAMQLATPVPVPSAAPSASPAQ